MNTIPLLPCEQLPYKNCLSSLSLGRHKSGIAPLGGQTGRHWQKTLLMHYETCLEDRYARFKKISGRHPWLREAETRAGPNSGQSKRFSHQVDRLARSFQKRAVLLAFSVGAFAVANAQLTVELKSGDTVIHPLVTKVVSKQVMQVALTLELSAALPRGDTAAAAPADVTLPVVIKTTRTPKIKPVLITETVKILKSEWPTAGKKDTVSKTVVLQTSSTAAFANDESFLITLDKANAPKGVRIDDSNESNFQVRVSLLGAFDLNKPFWVEVGSNFDLVDGVVPNNFFTGVFFYRRDIRPVFYGGKTTKDHSNNLAVFAGVFESKSTSSVTEEPLSFARYYDSTSLIPGNRDSLSVYTAAGTRTKKVTVRNVSLFFSPQVRLTNGSANEDGFHVFASFWSELQWQRVLEERVFNQFRVTNTEKLPMSRVLNNDSFLTKDYSKTFDLRSHYLGFGLPVFFKQTVSNDIVHLFVNPVFGYSNQPTEAYLQQRTQYDSNPIKYPLPSRTWNPFYIVQFRLNEESYGFAFTGEVRGLLRKNNSPIVSMSLTKKFDLTKFLEFNKP